MAIQKEIWQDHIEGNLFKNNEFILASTDASQYVLQGKVVHIPQAGVLPNVVRNRTSLPASVTQRGDTDVTYELDEFSSDPILIPNAETIELSYSKRESVLGEHEAALREKTAETILAAWAPATGAGGTVLRTTGAAIPTHISGSTGNRKKFTVADLKQAQNYLNKQNIPGEERYALMSADMFQQLTDAMSSTDYRDFSQVYDAQEGVLGKLFGFRIMVRGNVVSYNNDSTPVLNALGAAATAADNDAIVCWQKSAVEHAIGTLAFYESIGDPTYYGDVYSMSLRMGGRKRRADGKGVVAIAQASAS